MIDHAHLNIYRFEERQFDAWAKTQEGAVLMAQEQKQLTLLMPKVFGHFSVYLGLNSKLSSALASPIKSAIALTSNVGFGGHALMDPHQLPLASEAISLLVLQHVLDMSHNPHQILRECARVMTPGGRLIITGLNPYGLWGLWRHLKLKRGVPWRANFLAQHRLKDLLTLLSFGDFDIKPVYDCAPDSWKARPWSRYILNPFCAGYILSAVKQETRVNLIKPGWTKQALNPHFGIAGLARQSKLKDTTVTNPLWRPVD